MVDVTYQMVLSTIQTASLVVGIVYYLTIMRNTQKTREQSLKTQEEAEKRRQRELIFQRIQFFDLPWARAWGDVMLKDPDKWEEVYDPRENLESYANMAFVRNRYENLGIMLREGFIEAELLFQMFNPGSILAAWEHYKENIASSRERRYQPDLFRGFEYLAIEAQKKYPEIVPTKPNWSG